MKTSNTSGFQPQLASFQIIYVICDVYKQLAGFLSEWGQFIMIGLFQICIAACSVHVHTIILKNQTGSWTS